MGGKTTRKTKALRLTEQDFDIIARLQQHYGIASQNEVIRMALRAALRELPLDPSPKQGLALPPHGWKPGDSELEG